MALAALEPHFGERLRQHFALPRLDAASLAELFSTHDAAYWHAWAREHDMPLAAVAEYPTTPKD